MNYQTALEVAAQRKGYGSFSEAQYKLSAIGLDLIYRAAAEIYADERVKQSKKW